MKKLIVIRFCCFALAYLLLCCQNKPAVLAQQKVSIDTIPQQKKLKDTIAITAVGDIMLGSAFPSVNNLPPDDALNSFKAVDTFLKGDIVFGNLEGCFLDTGKSDKCKGINPNNCYAFRMPNRYAGIFKLAGFNLLSVANNHVGDFNHAGRKNTAEVLDSLGINYAGQLNKPYQIFAVDSVKYGFAAFAPNENTVDIRNIKEAKRLIAELKSKVDIVIVSFHGGAEGAKYEHVTRKTEIFYKENRGNVYAFAHAVVDAGADVVLGHGPHVTRAVEVYKNKFIAYSLGNFCTYGMFSLSGSNGIAPLLQIKVNAKGNFIYADVISVKQTKQSRLTVDDTHAAFKKIKSLSDIDFPNHQLNFANNRITLNEK